MPRYALIVAAGQGSRMQQSMPKQFMLLAGKPVLQYSLEAFAVAFADVRFIIVLPEKYPEWVHTLPQLFPGHTFQWVLGGATRFDSVKAGLKDISEPNALVFVHDAARPLVSEKLIHRCEAAALQYRSAIPCVPATESLRQIQADGQHHTLDRQAIRYVQTPQTFRAEWLLQAFQQPYRPEFTDEATVVEQAGYPVHLIEGETTNIKITYPHDLKLAEALLSHLLDRGEHTF
ncbi:MAG: 2-C-methyl-D-erythritol 4-phosphate cytidylyltransferase [Thermoflavifilum sp.]|nr:2-C-methyl-D-erythritol 4-phosphate cytidylyltransferase [Thermoflavifilum sp.]